MAQNPVLTQAQCSATGTTFTVRVSWQYIQDQTWFVAVVFDPSNNIIASKTVDGSRGTTVASLTGVTLAAATSYTVRVAQSDSSGNPTSSYSQPLNVLQAPLTNIETVNDMTEVAIAATLPAVGSPSGISVNLYDSTNKLIASAGIAGASGVIDLSQPLDPALTYYAYLAPSSNQGLSTGGNQRVDLQMVQPAISAISYDGNNMNVETATTLPAGSTLSGTLLADGSPIQEKAGSNVSVSFELAMATLDMSNRYSCALRAVNGGNKGPASAAVPAVVAPARLESAYYAGGHVGARWAVPPVDPIPPGALLTVIADGHVAGTPKTTLGYLGDVDISNVTVATSLKVQVNSVFGVAKGPPASVDLPFSKPSISSVKTGGQSINVAWTDGGTAPGYRLYLNDSNGKAIASVDTTDLAGALAPPVNPDAVYVISVQPFGVAGAGIEVTGPMSDTVALLAGAPAVTTTSYDGAKVTVNWTAPEQTAGIGGYEAELLDAETLRPTGAKSTANADKTSVQISATLDATSRVVAAVRATGSKSRGALGPAVEVIAVTPVITATDVSATSVLVAWSAPATAAVTGYTVTISDDAPAPATKSWDTSDTVLTVPNTLSAAQVHVRVRARGPSSTGPVGGPVNLFGTSPSFYPQPVSHNDPTPWLIRSSSNQPAAADIIFAFPDVFTTTPATLPSAGIFALQANGASAVLPYKLTIAANSVAWSLDPASRAMLASDFLNFLKKMEMPDGTNVQIKPGALVMVRQSLALGLPLLFSEQLKFMYGFDPDAQTGGFVDLVPGMRLRVDSEVQQLTPPANNQMGYVPAGMSTYDVQSYVQGQSLDIGFDAFLSAIGRPTVPTALRQPNAGGGGVIDLYNADGRKPYFRLLYPSAIRDPKYTGLVDESTLPVILGAESYNALVAATGQYVSQGNFTGMTGIFPFYFRGRATLTPEISASLNGQSRWLAVGSTVANLIAPQGAQPACVSAAVGGFTMRRSVGALSNDVSATAIATTAVTTNRVRLEYPVATFSPTQPGYFGLPLFCGDDIRLDQGGPA